MSINGLVSPKKTICKYRWSYPVVHINRGEIRTCDKTMNVKITESMLQELGTDAFINNPYLIERRYEKLKGYRHSDCTTCIKLEDKGVQSTRTGEAIFTNFMNKSLNLSQSFESYCGLNEINPTYLRADHPDILEISLSNVCNLKCVYCSPVFSTLWEEEAVRFGDMKKDGRERMSLVPPSFEKYFWEWFDKIKGGLNRIIFIGGEPLIQDKLYEFLEIMIAIMPRREKKIHLNIISNFAANDYYFEKFINLIPELSRHFVVNIESSIESVGERAEYIRFGLKWEQFEKNVRKLLAHKYPGVRYGLQMAINALCISSLHELLDWAANLQEEFQTMIDFKENLVMAPEYLSPLILTPDFISYLDKCIQITEKRLAHPKTSFLATTCKEWSHDRWQQYLPFLQSLRSGISRQESMDSHLKSEFYRFVKRNDLRRNSNFLKTFPEYAMFFDLCEKHGAS